MCLVVVSRVILIPHAQELKSGFISAGDWIQRVLP